MGRGGMSYKCHAALTERWMVQGGHGSLKRSANPDSCLSAHQWRIASCWADGTAESYSRQLRRQEHWPAVTPTSFSFNLTVGWYKGMPVLCGMTLPLCYSTVMSFQSLTAQSFCLSHPQESHTLISFSLSESYIIVLISEIFFKWI